MPAVTAYVVFIATTQTSCAFNSAEVKFEHWPPTFDDIEEVSKLLIAKHDYTGCTIINWKLLSPSEV